MLHALPIFLISKVQGLTLPIKMYGLYLDMVHNFLVTNVRSKLRFET